MENSQLLSKSRISIDESLQLDPPSEKDDGDYLCPICNCIIYDPIGCGVCKQHLCSECFSEWKEKGKTTCPISGCSNFKEEQAHPFFFKYLSSIKLKCPNHTKGCDQVVLHEQYKKHFDVCEFAQWACENGGCEFKGVKKESDSHSKSCEYLLIDCVWCHNQIPQIQYAEHDEKLCEEKKIECLNAGCGRLVLRNEFQEHCSSCEFQQVTCEMCKLSVSMQSHQDHKLNICEERQVECKGCRQLVIGQSLNTHIEVCEEILVSCKMCEREFQKNQFQIHSPLECLMNSFVSMKKQVDQLSGQNLSLKNDLKNSLEYIRSLEDEVIKQKESMVSKTQLMAEQSSVKKVIFQLLKHDLIPHCEKSHSFQLETYQLALKHYLYLHGSYILYDGWHKLHCGTCMSTMGKLIPEVDQNLDQLDQLDRKMNEIVVKF